MSLIARSSSQSAFGNACTGGANLKNHFSPLAPPVQIEKAAFEPLHRWCKSQKPLFSPCTTGASHEKYFLVVAPPVQAFPKTFWPSCDSRRNSLLALFLHRTHVIIERRRPSDFRGARQRGDLRAAALFGACDGRGGRKCNNPYPILLLRAEIIPSSEHFTI